MTVVKDYVHELTTFFLAFSASETYLYICIYILGQCHFGEPVAVDGRHGYLQHPSAVLSWVDKFWSPIVTMRCTDPALTKQICILLLAYTSCL